MGMVEGLWKAREMPLRDGLYRPDDTGLELHVDGPGAYHPDAGQPIPFRFMAGVHTIWSISVPIAIMETLAGSRRTTPWLASGP
ncbi:hypothetical protein ACIBO2_52785 [Nonomuraea sp. NPDC050022]|uniref:hypothetical protein n=1 Tax=unclassified Nonomuraea TaxID=2593643 RepID=UPI0033CAF529